MLLGLHHLHMDTVTLLLWGLRLACCTQLSFQLIESISNFIFHFPLYVVFFLFHGVFGEPFFWGLSRMDPELVIDSLDLCNYELNMLHEADCKHPVITDKHTETLDHNLLC